MDSETIGNLANQLIGKLRQVEAANAGAWRPGMPSVEGLQAQTVEFLKTFAGPKSAFVERVQSLTGSSDGYKANVIVSVLEAFVSHLESGLLSAVSPERRGQLDVMSDLLRQAAHLLDDHSIHPAAPAMIIGASLEEFLRTWVEAENLPLGARSPTLSNLSHVLREAELIGKQDVKDIESWAGLRNHAAHGHWDQVQDRNRIALMLDGVNLFLRQHTH